MIVYPNQSASKQSALGNSSVLGATPSIIYTAQEQSKFEIEQEKQARIDRIK